MAHSNQDLNTNYTHRVLVAVVDALQQLVKVLLGCVLAQPTRRCLQLVEQRVVQVLEHQVEPPLAPEHLYHVHEVVMAEFLKVNGTLFNCNQDFAFSIRTSFSAIFLNAASSDIGYYFTQNF